MKKHNINTGSTIKELVKNESFSTWTKIFSPKFRHWSKTILKLLFQLFFITWAVFTITFILVNLIPGDPKVVTDAISSKATPETINALRDLFHLNENIFTRYLFALGDAFSGTFGITGGEAISTMPYLMPKLLLSLQIGFIAISLSIIIGIPIGIYLARREGLAINIVSTFVGILAFSIPSFLMGLVFVLISYASGMPILFEFNMPYMYIIPALAIAIPVGLGYTRYLRLSVRQEMKSQYIQLARVKGLSEKKILYKHVLKPSLFPILTYFPFVVTFVLLGSVTIESLFSIPGMGQELVAAAINKDQNVMLAIVTIYSILITLAFFIRDISLQFIDPRLGGK